MKYTAKLSPLLITAFPRAYRRIPDRPNICQTNLKRAAGKIRYSMENSRHIRGGGSGPLRHCVHMEWAGSRRNWEWVDSVGPVTAHKFDARHKKCFRFASLLT